MNVIARIWQMYRRTTPVQWVQALVGTWLWAAAAVVMRREDSFEQLPFAQNIPFWAALAVVLGGGLLVITAAALLPRWKWAPRVMISGVCALALALAMKAENERRMYLFLALAALTGVMMCYAKRRDLLAVSRLRVPRGISVAFVGGMFLAIAAVLSIFGCMRYATYTAPNFDFGIFCQMFHNMKETGLPLTTCERDRLLSHFAVHISPIYYVLLPFYMVFPSPYTLAIGQAVVVASGVFPLYLLAKKKGLSEKACMVLAVLYAAYPVLSTGCRYDFHENCFLAPLLLWMFCAYEHKKTLWLFAAMAAVLMVKEDAAVFVVIFGLYVLAEHRDWRRGGVLIGVALVWFATALWLLDTFGEGGMIGRYGDFQYNDGGLVSMVKTLVVNPGLFLSKGLYGTQSAPFEKVWYLVYTVLPLASLLFGGKHFARYILFMPVAVNLLSNWPYQYDIGFQYSFGVAAFLLYVGVLNAADYEPPARRAAIAWGALAAVMLYAVTFWPSVKSETDRYKENRETYQRLETVLATVPSDASVTCSTFLLPHLASREVLYEDFYHPQTDTDYAVIDLRPGYRGGNYDEILVRYADAGFTAVVYEEDVAAVLKSPTA